MRAYPRRLLVTSEPRGRVRIRCQLHDDGMAAARIADESQGMDAATQAHIFEQFYQGDTSHRTEGNDLGLPLVAKVVDLHRGRIEVESAPATVPPSPLCSLRGSKAATSPFP